MKKTLLLSLLGSVSLLTGCNTVNTSSGLQDADELTVFRQNEKYGEKVAADIQKTHPRARILISDFVNVNNLNNTDGLGRITAEQVAGKLAAHQLVVLEPRIMQEGTKPSIGVREDNKDNAGEFSLSRTITDAGDYNADYIVAGTYSYGEYNTIINLKVIDKDRILRFAYNYTVPATVSFDWDKHSLQILNNYNVEAKRRVREYWDPYKVMDKESDIK